MKKKKWNQKKRISKEVSFFQILTLQMSHWTKLLDVSKSFSMFVRDTGVIAANSAQYEEIVEAETFFNQLPGLFFFFLKLSFFFLKIKLKICYFINCLI